MSQGNQGGKPNPTTPPDGPTSGGMSSTPVNKADVRVHGFIVECADNRNSSTIPLDHMRLRLRGRWMRSLVQTQDIGELAKMPDSPGIRLEMNARDRKLRIFDPLATNPVLLDKISRAFNDIQAIKTNRKQAAWPEAVYDLTQDQFKSILIEISKKVHGPEPMMIVVQGEVPTVDEIKGMDGRELFDPWSNSPDKPTYVDQVEDWKNRWDQLSTLLSALSAAGA
jgi:hypothetical protein